MSICVDMFGYLDIWILRYTCRYVVARRKPYFLDRVTEQELT